MSVHSPITSLESGDAAPGRNCPLHYRYAPADLARPPDLRAGVLYVIGGLYGNRPALEAVLGLATRETGPVTLVFNGDFNWFNIDDAGFHAINEEVLKHHAMRGNVETEIASEDPATGCGCGYPDWVGDDDVERSNEIIAHLRMTARRHPGLRERLGVLPMHLVAEVDEMRVGIVHGDAESLAGWSFSQELLATPDTATQLAMHFEQANVRVFASSHTCLPVATDYESRRGRCVLINNGAAGMPNFERMTCGVITRIAPDASPSVKPLYATRLDSVLIEALPVHYDPARWLEQFSANWPEGTAAHQSYYRRLTQGPLYGLAQAVRWRVSP